jgi:hypothetical protein
VHLQTIALKPATLNQQLQNQLKDRLQIQQESNSISIGSATTTADSVVVTPQTYIN